MRCGGSSRGGGSGRIWWHLARGGQTVDSRFGWVWCGFGDLGQKTIFAVFLCRGSLLWSAVRWGLRQCVCCVEFVVGGRGALVRLE